MNDENRIVYILTEQHVQDDGSLKPREITGFCSDPVLAGYMLTESMYGEMEIRQLTREQIQHIQAILLEGVKLQ